MALLTYHIKKGYNFLTSAIIFQPIQGSVISMGLYHDIYESREVMDKIMEYIASGKENTFQMP